jgi:hypothetical protein
VDDNQYPDLADIVRIEGVNLPLHLLALLQQNEYESIPEILDATCTTDEEERDAIWRKADHCALLRVLLPYRNQDGSCNKEGRKLAGKLASDLKCSSQTIRRYIDLGLTFPPELQNTDQETGEVTTIILRDPATPMNVYEAALSAERYNLAPLMALLKALETGWSAGQLRKWLREDKWREEGLQPPVTREWFKQVLPEATQQDFDVAWIEAKEEAYRQFRMLRERQRNPLQVSIRIGALEPGEAPAF